MESKSRVDYNTKVLQVKNLKKYFYHGVGKNKLTVPAVDGLTFDVYKREVFGLVGESGCGKTTTGRTIIKLLNPTEGVVQLNDNVVCAGYLDHVRDIKRIKEEANEKILSYNEKKKREIEIKKQLKIDVDFQKSEIQMVKAELKEELKQINEPIDTYKQEMYHVKNDYDLEVERINYNYDLEHSNTVKLTYNVAQVDYDHEVKSLNSGMERKVHGLKDSAALTQEVIEARIAKVQADTETALKALEEKYAPLIKEEAKNIISKEEGKNRIAKLKATRKENLAERKAEYLSKKANVKVPDKTSIKVKVQNAKAASKTKVDAIKAKIKDLQEKAKAEIAGLKEVPDNSNDPAIKAKIAEITAERDRLVAEKKDIIQSLKYTNKSKEALEYSRKMQMIFQDPISSLNPRMTVQEIVGEGLTIRGEHSKEEIKAKVGDVLEIVGLSRDYATRYPHEFSGGQRQRIGVARALIMNPDFIIADEPISALDVSIRAQVINLLSDLKESLGLTILFIAHDLSVVRFFCDRIAVMYNGKIVELAEAEELFNYPLHPYTRSLLSSVPQPDPDYEKNRTRINYNPRMHDYRLDKPELREIRPNHFIYVNDKEYAEIAKTLKPANGKVKEGEE